MLIAQISDSHIKLGGAADANLARAVEYLLRLPASPDVVILTGDCVDTGSPAEYERFRELLGPLTMPVYVVPGNHDDRARLLAQFGPQGSAPLAGFAQYAVEDWPVRLLALDTNVPGRGEGLLCDERLAWLEERLAEAPARPTMIFMHHPPFPIGLAPFDQIGLGNAGALGAIVARHPQIERIVAGHVHACLQRRFHGTLAMPCPATAYQLVFDMQRPERVAASMQSPACLLHYWEPASGLITHASLIGESGPLVELHDGERWV
jgi:3',5'-cyclic AMP phosphodiesterase CpdA